MYNLRYLITRLLTVRKFFRHSGAGRKPVGGKRRDKKAYIAAYAYT